MSAPGEKEQNFAQLLMAYEICTCTVINIAEDTRYPEFVIQHKKECKNNMKPTCKLIGGDGNVFVLAAQVTKVLKKAGLLEQSKEFNSKLWSCESYDEALCLMQEYVEVE